MPFFIDTYLDNSPKLLAEIVKAVSAGDLEAIFNNAHQLKGGSGSIGAMQVFQLAKKIEEISQKGTDDGSLAALIIELETAYVAAEAELKKHL